MRPDSAEIYNNNWSDFWHSYNRTNNIFIYLLKALASERVLFSQGEIVIISFTSD